MGAQATRLSDLKVKAAKPKDKYYVLVDGDSLQLRVRTTGSKLWNFNYIHPVTKKRISMGLGTFPEVSPAHPFGTLMSRMGATHFLTRTLDRVSTEMNLHVLAYNLTALYQAKNAGRNRMAIG